MRATVSSRVLALTALVAVTGCTHSTGTYRRGQALSTSPGQSSHQDSPEVQISSDVARLVLKRTTCTEVTTTYATSEIQKVSSPDWGLVGGGLGLAVGGMFLATVETDEEALGYLAAGALVGGVVVALYGIVNGEESEELVPSSHTENDVQKRCSDSVVPRTERVDWKVTAERNTDSGRTGPDGTLELPPVVAKLAGSKLDFNRVIQFARGQGIPYRVTLDAYSANGVLENLPESVYERYAREFESRLSGDGLSKWQNCRVISQSFREAFKCFASQ